MICSRCQALFSGEIAQYYDDLKDEHIFLRRKATILYSPTELIRTDDCALCYRMYELLETHYTLANFLRDEDQTSAYIDLEITFTKKGGRCRGSLRAVTTENIFCFTLWLEPTSQPLIALLLDPCHPVIDATTNSTYIRTLTRTWLGNCVQNHEACNINKPQVKLPSRLLKLDTPTSHHVQLQDTSTMQFKPSYMTLSHCWGDEKFLTLSSSTEKELYVGIFNSKLAQTFQDAISIASSLGSQYLWIDSLCILQDSKEDWSCEAPLMAAVYRGSTCNIAASASKGAYDGCFRSRVAHLVPPIVITTEYTDRLLSNTEYLLEIEDYHNIVHDTEQPLFSRGWVFQERILAPRTLHFGSQYVFWECKTSGYSERYPRGYPTAKETPWGSIPIQLSKEHEDKRFELWCSAICEYSSMHLTFSVDRLIAISGVARHLHTLVPTDRYLAGLWHKEFLAGLLWSSWDFKAPCLIHLTEAESRPLPYRAPTWSWASTIGGITMERYPNAGNLCTIEAVTLHFATEDIYGGILDGHLKARGQLLKCNSFNITNEVSHKIWTSYTTTNIPLTSLDGRYSVYIGTHLALDSSLDSRPRSVNLPMCLASPFYFFPLLTNERAGLPMGLLLLPTAKAGCYERCGTFDVFSVKDDTGVEQDGSWGGLKARAKARQDLRPEDEPFEIVFTVGPNGTAEQAPAAMPADTFEYYEGWEEYEEFDGQDYTFSII